MSAPNKPHPLSSLSFVLDRLPKSRTNVKRCFWHVQPIGNVLEDHATGERFAIEYLRFLVREGLQMGYLPAIVADMPTEMAGIERGFLRMINYAATYGLPHAERYAEVARRWGCQIEFGALVNQRPDGSVVIEQSDGTRAVYRKVGAE
jgi:hypothetical protein